jgi:hypothetical protein
MQQSDMVPMVRNGTTMKAYPYTWPANGSVMISTGTSAPQGLAAQNGYCLVGYNNAWAVLGCTSALAGNGLTLTGSTLSINPLTATAALNPFTSSLQGVVPASGGGTTNFLRADGTWTSPGAGSVTVTGSPSSGNLSKFSGASSITNTDLTGDVTTSGTVATTLATVNSNVGTFGSSTAIPTVTFNGKGLATAVSTNVVVAPAGTLSGTTLNSTVTGSSLTSVGTIATGVWNGTLIGASKGGTGISNTATLTLGTSNINFATLGTGIVKNTTTTGALTNAASADIVSLFTGCSGTQYLGADGACHAAGGSGTVTSVTFTGDGTILSSTPSSAVTTSGTLTAALATQTANTVLGALTATTPSDLAVPSCSAAGDALKWTSGTGFGCATGFLTGNQTITLSGDASGSGTTAITVDVTELHGNTITNGDWCTSNGTIINCNTGAPVTSFSAGNLSPLFTTSVATSTTTPALSFSLTNAGANSVFGNDTGSSAAPSYQNSINIAGPITSIPVSLTYSSGFTPLVGNGSGTTSSTERIVLIHVNCSSGCAINNPTGTALDGEKLTLEIWQSSSGSDTVTFGTAFDFGTPGAPTLSTAASAGDYVGFQYSSNNSKWNYLGSLLGH